MKRKLNTKIAMPKILTIVLLLFLGITVTAQTTAIPDSNFEQALIDLGHDTTLDGSVLTSNISGVTYLNLISKSISDLTGIEDFSALETLHCRNNSIDDLDLSQNTALSWLDCRWNGMKTLNVKNGNNTSVTSFNTEWNNALTCIQVDNEAYSTTNWTNVDPNSVFRTNCNDPSTTYIPDDNFEQALIDLGRDTVLDDHVLTIQIVGLTSLNLINKSISDLTGIEDFANLRTLNCRQNNLSTLDLSQNSLLKTLDCRINSIENLDLSQNTALSSLDCRWNNMKSLNVKNGNNTSVTSFYAEWNNALTCIQVDNEAYSTTNWTNVDPNSVFRTNCNNSSTTYIPDDNFEQALIDLGRDTVLDDYVFTSNISGITSLNVSNKSISDLTGIEDFSALIGLSCDNNNLTSLDLSNNTNLESLYCPHNQITSIDLSTNANMTYLGCRYNNITNLNLGNSTYLTTVHCSYNPISTLDISNNTQLNQLECNHTNLTNLISGFGNSNLKELLINNTINLVTIDLNNYTNLEYLNITGNHSLTNLNINANTKLTRLVASQLNNLAGNIDFSNNLNILDIDISSSNITSVNIANNTLLKKLRCADNNINVLDLMNHIALTELNCSTNNLTSLDLNQNSALTLLACANNNLISLNIKNGNNTAINIFNAENNPNLTCIEVDNALYSTTNWTNIDAASSFSTDCSSGSKEDISKISNDITGIYPNPVIDVLNIDGISFETVQIFNSVGKQVINTNESKIDMSNLPSGVYVLKILSSNEIITKTIVKN